jgi:hypothetical protein
VEEVLERVRKREWRGTLSGILILACYYPRGFASVPPVILGESRALQQ